MRKVCTRMNLIHRLELGKTSKCFCVLINYFEVEYNENNGLSLADEKTNKKKKKKERKIKIKSDKNLSYISMDKTPCFYLIHLDEAVCF